MAFNKIARKSSDLNVVFTVPDLTPPAPPSIPLIPFPLVEVEDANGNHDRFVYHPLNGLPQYVIDDNGRVFSLNFGNVADEQSP